MTLNEFIAREKIRITERRPYRVVVRRGSNRGSSMTIPCFYPDNMNVADALEMEYFSGRIAHSRSFDSRWLNFLGAAYSDFQSIMLTLAHCSKFPINHVETRVDNTPEEHKELDLTV